MNDDSRRVVVVGGGVIGLATAWYLTKQGIDVTVVERGSPRRNGCSYGNAGMLVPSHVIPLACPGMIWLGLKMMTRPKSPFFIKPRPSLDLVKWLWQFRSFCNKSHVDRSAPLLRDLHLQSRACYQELEQELPGGINLTQRGLLMLCKTQAFLDEEAHAAELANSLGVAAEVHDAKSTAALDRGVTMDVAGSVFYPLDCHLSPNRLMTSLQRELETKGCRFVWEADCRRFRSEGKRITSVQTSQGEIDGDEFVLCSGIWSTELAKTLNLNLPMQAGKGYSFTIDTPAQLPELCSLLMEARIAVTPMETQLRFGGTMEMAGIDESITRSRVRGIIDAIPEYFPAFSVDDLEGRDVWSGLRPCSPDGMPFLGRTATCPNLIVATGHAMMGISLAMISGKLVSQIVEGRVPSVERMELLSPDRFLAGTGKRHS